MILARSSDGSLGGVEDFSRVVQTLGAYNDASLAVAIESHARRSIEAGAPIALDIYLSYMQPVQSYPVSLDAAIEYLLRSNQGMGIDELVRDHPGLETMIREAAMLNAAIDGIGTVTEPGEVFKADRLPMEFGPVCYCRDKQYTLVEQIGSGASGVVFRAIDHVLSDEEAEEHVAIKVLSRVPDADDPARRLEEAFKARFVKQENVVRVLSCGMEDGFPFIVLELVDGESLWDASSAGRIDGGDAIGIMMDAARGIHAAHRAGVSHMDLKPQNILLDREGRARVTDFGVAVSTLTPDADEATRLRGTIAFMAPEQLSGAGAHLTQASDIFGLGSILIWLLTGEIPTLGDGKRLFGSSLQHRLDTLCSAIAHEHGRDLGVICRRATSMDPLERYPSASELGDDLRRWQERRPLEWTRPGCVGVSGCGRDATRSSLSRPTSPSCS